jgi:hypothetical protein
LRSTAAPGEVDAEGRTRGPRGEPRLEHARIARDAGLVGGGLTLVVSARLVEGPRTFPGDAGFAAARALWLRCQDDAAAAWMAFLTQGRAG